MSKTREDIKDSCNKLHALLQPKSKQPPWFQQMEEVHQRREIASQLAQLFNLSGKLNDIFSDPKKMLTFNKRIDDVIKAGKAIKLPEATVLETVLELHNQAMSYIKILKNPKEMENIKSDPDKLRKFLKEASECAKKCKEIGLVQGEPLAKEVKRAEVNYLKKLDAKEKRPLTKKITQFFKKPKAPSDGEPPMPTIPPPGRKT